MVKPSRGTAAPPIIPASDLSGTVESSRKPGGRLSVLFFSAGQDNRKPLPEGIPQAADGQTATDRPDSAPEYQFYPPRKKPSEPLKKKGRKEIVS